MALIVEDPAAPDAKAPKTTWIHWILYNIPSSVHGLAEDAARRRECRETHGPNLH
ncbi:MAG: hypothetical protein ACLQFT_03380 [Steroidobacteraceae bacterium]